MPVTLRDIAKELNLSHATVSFVLNQRHDVAIPEKTRQRVFEMARQLGYRPNNAARALVSGRTQMLAISVPVLRHPYFVGVFHSLFEICQQKGYGVFVYQASRGPARRAFDWPVDGVIVADGADMIQRGELPAHLPVVSIGSYVDTDVDHVMVDIMGGARAAVTHLVEIGCKRIVHVRIPVAADMVDDRDLAYIEILRDSKFRTETITIPRAEPEEVRGMVREYVVRNGKPDGFFCTNDLSALATIRGMADLQFFAPKDYAIVGFDGIDQGEMTVPSISTVSQPVQQMCDYAVEFLLNRIREPNRAIQSATLSSSLIVRESTRIAPAVLLRVEGLARGALRERIYAPIDRAVGPRMHPSCP